MKQIFTLDGKALGTREISAVVTIGGEDRKTPNSYHLFCGVCGRVWGEILCDSPRSYHQPVSSNCRAHRTFPQDGHLAIMNRCLGHPRDLEWDWPPDALAYEIRLLCEDFIKEHENE